MKPTASAPIATLSSASSSLVIPQIFTNMQPVRYRRAHRGAGTVSRSAGDERGDRSGRIRSGDQRLAHQHGVVPGAPQRTGVGRATHTALGHLDDAYRHCTGHPYGPLVIDFEGDEIA